MTGYVNKVEAERLYDQGNVSQRMGLFDEALNFYDQAIALDGSNPMYYNNRAATLKRLGRIQGAIKQYQDIVDKFPDYGKVFLSLANTYIESDNCEEALDNYQYFLNAYRKGQFTFNPIMGGIDQSKNIYGKNILEVIFMTSINYLDNPKKKLAVNLFNRVLQEFGDSEYSEIDIDIAIESVAINNAIIFADYANNAEIFKYNVKMLKRNFVTTVDNLTCNNWYLETNNNQGPSSSYSLDILVYRTPEYVYRWAMITCGLAATYGLYGSLKPKIGENLKIFYFFGDSPAVFVWTTDSVWDINDQALTRSVHDRISALKQVEPIVKVTENFAHALVESLR